MMSYPLGTRSPILFILTRRDRHASAGSFEGHGHSPRLKKYPLCRGALAEPEPRSGAYTVPFF